MVSVVDRNVGECRPAMVTLDNAVGTCLPGNAFLWVDDIWDSRKATKNTLRASTPLMWVAVWTGPLLLSIDCSVAREEQRVDRT